jgi:hypothetical protein
MKDTEEMKAAWGRMSTHPDFRDCMRDLMRYQGFWRPMGNPSPEAALCKMASQALITYIIDKVEWSEVPADFTFDEKTKRKGNTDGNRR